MNTVSAYYYCLQPSASAALSSDLHLQNLLPRLPQMGTIFEIFLLSVAVYLQISHQATYGCQLDLYHHQIYIIIIIIRGLSVT